MLQITAIPAFADNYIWMLKQPESNKVVLVDPGDEKTIMAYVEKNNLDVLAVLITHQHYDHTGGVAALLIRFPDLKVYCHDTKVSKKALRIDLPIPHLITHKVVDADQFTIDELGLSFKVMTIPGHTLDHVAFYNDEMVFVGDTIFGCGCGFLFSGTANQMAESMNRLSTLPSETKLYCAHEYTVDSIGFALWLEPDNQDIKLRLERELKKQEQGLPTMPSSLQIELKTNPFMRFKIPKVKQAAEKYAGKKLTTDGEVFAVIREWKNTKYDN